MADRLLRRTLMKHAVESHREATMYPMPTNEARQLVAERRSSYEAIAFRRHFRRYLTRHVTHPALSGTRTAHRSPLTLVTRHDATPTAPTAPTCKVA
jgi:hypothetical protein